MDLTRFKKLHEKYSQFPLSKEILETSEYEEYTVALDEDTECNEWFLKSSIKEAGLDYKKYCCLDMTYHLIEGKKGKGERNHDSVMTHTPKRKEFGIPIHDGGISFIKINYCPWCGEKL